MNKFVFDTLRPSDDYRLNIYNEGKREWLSIISFLVTALLIVTWIVEDNIAYCVFATVFGCAFAITTIIAFKKQTNRKRQWRHMLFIVERFEKFVGVSVTMRHDVFNRQVHHALLEMAKDVVISNARLQASDEELTYVSFELRSKQLGKNPELRRKYQSDLNRLEKAAELTVIVSGNNVIWNEGDLTSKFLRKANTWLGIQASKEHYRQLITSN